MNILPFILSVVMVMIIGLVADKIAPFQMLGGWAGAIVSGFIGAWVGPLFLGHGIYVARFFINPSLDWSHYCSQYSWFYGQKF